MKTSTTRWRIPPAAWVPVGLAFCAEAFINASRGYSLGAHLADQTVVVHGYQVSLAGIGCVAAALALSTFQSLALWAALSPGRDWRQRILAILMAALLLSISAGAMATHMLHAERAAGADDSTEQKAFDRADAALKRALAQYEAVKGAPTVAAVEAQIAALHIDPNIWRRTKECSPAETMKKSVWQDECKPFASMQKPLADARRKAELETALPALQDKLDSIKRPELATGIEEDIGRLWGWGVALAIVFVATAGAAIVAKVETVTVETDAVEQPAVPVVKPSKRPTPPPPSGGRRGRKRDPKVVDFVREFRKANGRDPNIPEMRNAFPQLEKTTAWRNAKSA